jgi:hypothetical protein
MEGLEKVTSRLGGPQAPSRFSLASNLLIDGESERIRAERFWTCSRIDRPASIVGTGVLRPNEQRLVRTVTYIAFQASRLRDS